MCILDVTLIGSKILINLISIIFIVVEISIPV